MANPARKVQLARQLGLRHHPLASAMGDQSSAPRHHDASGAHSQPGWRPPWFVSGLAKRYGHKVRSDRPDGQGRITEVAAVLTGHRIRLTFCLLRSCRPGPVVGPDQVAASALRLDDSGVQANRTQLIVLANQVGPSASTHTVIGSQLNAIEACFCSRSGLTPRPQTGQLQPAVRLVLRGPPGRCCVRWTL